MRRRQHHCLELSRRPWRAMILTRIQEAAARYPDHIAVQMKRDDGYVRFTYRDLMSSIASASRALSGLGVEKGDRVALLSENRPEWMIAYLTAVSLGAVVVPLDAQYTEGEVALLLSDSGAKAVFVSASTRPKLPENAALSVISFDPDGPHQFSA